MMIINCHAPLPQKIQLLPSCKQWKHILVWNIANKPIWTSSAIYRKHTFGKVVFATTCKPQPTHILQLKRIFFFEKSVKKVFLWTIQTVFVGNFTRKWTTSWFPGNKEMVCGQQWHLGLGEGGPREKCWGIWNTGRETRDKEVRNKGCGDKTLAKWLQESR